MQSSVPTPVTNLVAHQRLLGWYQGAERHRDKVLCPILAAIPGLQATKTLPCDCPESRRHFLVLETACHQDGDCLPRKAWDWPNSMVGKELQQYYGPPKK